LNAYIIKRAFLFVPTLFLVATLVFTVLRLVPGDPAVMMLTGGPQTEQAFTEEDLQKLRAKLGTDKPIIVQYGKWISRMLVLDFGTSYFYDQPVLNDLKKRFPITLELTVIALLMAGAVAIPLGVMSAIKQDSWPDYIGRIITIGGIAVPNFWIGILLVFALANVFGWLPPLGYEDFWNSPLENLQQLAFPALALAFTHMAFVARVTRSAALEVAREDYIRTARAKGLGETVVVWRHALRNTMLPVVTLSGVLFGFMLGGSVVLEQAFNVPGLGRAMVEAFIDIDYIVIQNLVLLYGVVFVVINLLIDVSYAWLDPRIRYGQ
jgi:peptide/nickel transport system permease protein